MKLYIKCVRCGALEPIDYAINHDLAPPEGWSSIIAERGSHEPDVLCPACTPLVYALLAEPTRRALEPPR